VNAYLVEKYKSPMKAGEVPQPMVGDRDVLVEIAAAGVNLLDAKIRSLLCGNLGNQSKVVGLARWPDDHPPRFNSLAGLSLFLPCDPPQRARKV
jgi:hypothetical protein